MSVCVNKFSSLEAWINRAIRVQTNLRDAYWYC